MKLFALTFGDPSAASSHYRIFQYQEQFAKAGIHLDHARAKSFIDFKQLANYDVVLLQKTLVATNRLRAIRNACKTLIYDADDRVWTRPGKPYGWLTQARINHRLKKITTSADLCLAANHVIASDLITAGARRIEVLPMALDETIWNPAERPTDEITIGWSGAPKNLAFLEPLAPVLNAVQSKHPQVRFAIHSGKKPSLPGLNFEHLPYVPNLEHEAVRQFDIGLLPLPDEPFVQGKSPIKALQYFATSTAVVGQATGATAELLKHNENALVVNNHHSWEANLESLLTDPNLRQRLSNAARQTFLSSHTKHAVFDALLKRLQITHAASAPV